MLQVKLKKYLIPIHFGSGSFIQVNINKYWVPTEVGLRGPFTSQIQQVSSPLRVWFWGYVYKSNSRSFKSPQNHSSKALSGLKTSQIGLVIQPLRQDQWALETS